MSEEKDQHESRRWFEQARCDLKAAQHSLQAGDFNWACFQAQQAGEKLIKACWYVHGLEPWGHSLVKLIADFPIAEVKESLATQLDNARRLDKLYIPTRYPNGLPDMIPSEVYSLSEAEEAVSRCRSLLAVAANITGFPAA